MRTCDQREQRLFSTVHVDFFQLLWHGLAGRGCVRSQAVLEEMRTCDRSMLTLSVSFFVLFMLTFFDSQAGGVFARRQCLRAVGAHHPPRHRARPQSRPQLRSNHHQSDRISVGMGNGKRKFPQKEYGQGHMILESRVWHALGSHKFTVTQYNYNICLLRCSERQ